MQKDFMCQQVHHVSVMLLLRQYDSVLLFKVLLGALDTSLLPKSVYVESRFGFFLAAGWIAVL